MAFSLLVVAAFCSFGVVIPTSIELPECEPPDFPKYGGYGPPMPFYLPGDQIHYYCDTDRYIGGNFLRICEDTGDWTGNAPVCDGPSEYSSVNQSSTFDRDSEHGAERAQDDRRDTCSLTRTGRDQYWTGMFKTPGELIRVMVFAPQVEVDYEVFLLKNGGQRMSCGRRQGYVERLNWEFHNCPGPNNRDAIGVQIITKSDVPLELCEVVAHVLTNPTCVDPHYRIAHGRLELTRKTATLVCDAGYTKSADKKLDCLRTGVWNRKNLRCLERSS